MKIPRAGFSLIELLVTVSLSGLLGGILYGLSTEAMVSFGRNISINKSYTDARMSLDRLGQMIQAAGHTPILLDATGTPTAATQAAGIRFWTCDSDPKYAIAAPVMTGKTLSLTLNPGQSAPVAGNLVFIDGIALQAVIPAGGVNANGTTITFPSALSTYLPASSAGATTASFTPASLLLFKQVAFIAVGTQLRYYPVAMTATGAANDPFNNANNYQVIANLVSNPAITAQSLPFVDGIGSTIQVTICAQAPDYCNRSLNQATGTNNFGSTYNSAGSAVTFTAMQSSFASRCPVILRAPF